MTIELIGGPLAGTIHEVSGGFDVPDAFGLPDDAKQNRHWYTVNEDGATAKYLHSEVIE